jgi:hypothetical protein
MDIREKLSAIFLLDPMDIIDLVGITAIMAIMVIMGIIGHMMSFSAFPQNRLNPAMRDIGDIIVCRLLLTIILIQIDAHRVHGGRPSM